MPVLEEITAALPRFREAAESMREIMLANLAMIGEIPAPTFGEDARIQFIASRFADAGLQNCSIDEKCNAIGVLAGSDGKQNLLLVAHADTIVKKSSDQTIEIQTDRMIGPFVGDNCIALAALATLPELLGKIGVRLKSNVLLVASSHILGRGNMEGVRYFLSNNNLSPAAGICLESVQLGRLNYSCMGMIRGEITCQLPADFKWELFGSIGSIIPLSEVINRISQISLPTRPLTRIIMGSVSGGISYNNIARETKLCFEARSESAEMIQQIRQQIEDIAEDVAAKSGTKIAVDIFARCDPGGLDIAHPLVRNARAVLTGLGLQPNLYPTTSLQSALRDAGIPALTLGITTGERKSDLDEIDESVAIAPIAAGLAQLVGVLMSVDGGLT